MGLGPEDVFFYFTTCGWMMWNWLVSGLASGATLALYDGSPFRPAPSALLDMAQEEGITVFGTSAKYIAALEKEHLRPRETHELSALRTILSTGSPLSHESFRYVYRDVKQDVCLSSISGGTDIVSCFVLGNECLPVREGEIQCLGLGMAVEFRNENGEPVIGEERRDGLRAALSERADRFLERSRRPEISRRLFSMLIPVYGPMAITAN